MTRPEWITPEDGPWLCTAHGILEEAHDGTTHCPDCTLAELAEIRGLLREALRKQGTETVDITFAQEQIARAERAEAALADVYDRLHGGDGPDLRRELAKARGLLTDMLRAYAFFDDEKTGAAARARAFLAGQETK